jgi:F-type H+-transporting ATPase subunit b
MISMIELIHQAGIIMFAAYVPATQPEPSLLDQVGQLLLGSIPTAILFIVLVLCYQFLIQRPLTRTLNERRARTEGAIEDAHRAISQAEARAADYATRLRQARAEIFKIREQRIKQWSAERDSALGEARKAAGLRVSQAKAELEAEAGNARQAIHASAADLARQVVRAVLPLTAGSTR